MKTWGKEEQERDIENTAYCLILIILPSRRGKTTEMGKRISGCQGFGERRER